MIYFLVSTVGFFTLLLLSMVLRYKYQWIIQWVTGIFILILIATYVWEIIS